MGKCCKLDAASGQEWGPHKSKRDLTIILPCDGGREFRGDRYFRFKKRVSGRKTYRGTVHSNVGHGGSEGETRKKGGGEEITWEDH